MAETAEADLRPRRQPVVLQVVEEEQLPLPLLSLFPAGWHRRLLPEPLAEHGPYDSRTVHRHMQYIKLDGVARKHAGQVLNA